MDDLIKNINDLRLTKEKVSECQIYARGYTDALNAVVKAIKNHGVSHHVSMSTWVFDCWDMSGALTTKKIQATCEEHAILKFEKKYNGDYGYDRPYSC